MLCGLLLTHLEQLGCIGAAAHVLYHAHAHKSGGSTGGIGGSGFHGIAPCHHVIGGSHVGVGEDGSTLHILEHLLVLLGGLDAGNAEGDNFNAPQLPPLFAQHLVEDVCQLHGVGGQAAVADAHFGNPGEGGL